MSAWYEIQNIDTLDTPALTVFPDRVQKNIETAIGYVDDVKRLRPHIKTHKSPDVLRLMLEAGITKFKCATIAEAEILVRKWITANAKGNPAAITRDAVAAGNDILDKCIEFGGSASGSMKFSGALSANRSGVSPLSAGLS